MSYLNSFLIVFGFLIFCAIGLLGFLAMVFERLKPTNKAKLKKK